MSFFRELNLKLKESTLIFIILASFFIVQFNYINIAGTTYDADRLRFGSNIIIEKIIRISSFNFNFKHRRSYLLFNEFLSNSLCSSLSLFYI